MSAIEYARRSSCCEGREEDPTASVSLRTISSRLAVLSTAWGQFPRASQTLIYPAPSQVSSSTGDAENLDVRGRWRSAEPAVPLRW